MARAPADDNPRWSGNRESVRNFLELELPAGAELAATFEQDLKVLERLRRATLYGPDGTRMVLGEPMRVQGKGFRIPFKC
jgi:hypothetical protein